MPDAATLIDGHTYRLNHCRFGRCEATVTHHDSEWADLLITKGRLVGMTEDWIEGEKKTVRLSHCRFMPLVGDARAEKPGEPR